MIDHELTDPTGSALTITHNVDGVWVTATVDRDEVTVGPFPARALRASFDMGDDLADGGVTAAAIENEVVSPERARSLVQENTELRVRIGRVEEARDLYRRDALTEERLHGEARRFALAWKETARRATRSAHTRKAYGDFVLAARDRAVDALNAQLAQQERAATASPRPMRAEDITAEMVERAQLRIKKRATFIPAETIRCALEDALTEPTPEPTDAEQVARFAVESKHHLHVTQCLCGFESHRARSRTEHIMTHYFDELTAAKEARHG